MALIGNVYYLPVLGEQLWVLAIVIWALAQGQSCSQVGAELQEQPAALGWWALGTGQTRLRWGRIQLLSLLQLPSLLQKGQFLTQVGFLPLNTHPSLPAQTRNDKTERPFRAKKPEICSWTASFFSRVSISNTFSQAESLPVSHHFHLQNWELENDNSAHAEMVQSRLKAAGIAALLVLYPALCWSHCSALISHNSSFSSKKKRDFFIFFQIST